MEEFNFPCDEDHSDEDLDISDEDVNTDSESEILSDNQPPSKKAKTMSCQPKKASGAAYYNTKFNKSWIEKYGCIQPVRNDPSYFLCTVCNKRIS